jgi:hypothetical protein
MPGNTSRGLLGHTVSSAQLSVGHALPPNGTPVGPEPVACRATRNWLIRASTRSARQAEPMLGRAEKIASEAGALMACSQPGSRRRGMTAY